MKRILVTGGCGYIGSHTVVELLANNYEVVIFDNLSNSSTSVLQRIADITKRRFVFVQGDLVNQDDVTELFTHGPFDAVIHFAGLKAVGESVEEPLLYYNNNLIGTIRLLEAMSVNVSASVSGNANPNKRTTFIFSSSATVYGDPERVPIPETARTSCTNPYGRTKLFIEEILRDWSKSDSRVSVIALRYFNPVGAHPSGLLGENPKGKPNNLMPYITEVAHGKRSELVVYGSDYKTPDGTGVRDYVHVVDLAKGHIRALERGGPGFVVYNLGTGRGYSVLEVVRAYERVNKVKIPLRMGARRPGDVASCYADVSRATRELGWSATLGLDEMCRSAWASATVSRG
jgi:UDP-glucose 4-epimerase